MIEKHFDLLIDSSNTDRSELTNEQSDMINIINPDGKTISEHENYFLRPLKIGYELNLPESLEEYLQSIKKNRRKRLKKTIRDSEDTKVKVEEPITTTTFSQWHNLYYEKMNSKDKGKVIIDKSWADNKDNSVGIFVYCDDKMLGGLIMKRIRGKLSVCYNAYIDFSFSVCDLLMIEAIKYAIHQKYKVLSRGQDTNLYGHHLSPGLYIYKKSLGFSLVPRFNKGVALTRFNSLEKFDDVIFFISFSDKSMTGLEGNLITDTKIEEDFSCDDLKKINVYSRSFF